METEIGNGIGNGRQNTATVAIIDIATAVAVASLCAFWNQYP